jgi:hypothetical protein
MWVILPTETWCQLAVVANLELGITTITLLSFSFQLASTVLLMVFTQSDNMFEPNHEPKDEYDVGIIDMPNDPIFRALNQKLRVEQRQSAMVFNMEITTESKNQLHKAFISSNLYPLYFLSDDPKTRVPQGPHMPCLHEDQRALLLAKRICLTSIWR